jgi:hypothetical protein
MPSDRLVRFRQYMAAFEGAADPAKSIEHGHYVHAPGQLLVDQITGRIALRPNSTHLLVGGIGSGKTTQLLMAEKQLEAIEDLAVCYVDVSRYTDISQIEPGVLMTIVALEIADLIPRPMDDSVQSVLKSLKMMAYGHITTKLVDPMAAITTLNSTTLDASRYILSPRNETTIHKGLLRKVQDPNPVGNHELEKIFHTILQTVTRHIDKTLVVLIDGLDRLDDTEKFSQMIRTDVQAMKASGVGTVIVGPILFIHSAYQNAKDLIDHLYYQPCFDVEKSAPARNFFTDVINTRLSEPDFFGQGSINLLVRQSGGLLRDLITLTQSAIEETYITGDQHLEQRHIDKAVQTLARAKIMGISEAALTILRHHLKDKDFVLGSSDSFQLLTSRRIIEYDYPNYRYVVHPVIAPLLQSVAA